MTVVFLPFLDRIETMYKSLAILKNLPGNMEREETCETFKNSLLTALRPIVRRDVAGLDTTPLQEYLYVFKKLGRYIILSCFFRFFHVSAQ